MANRQQVDENGRFPCRFPGCSKTYAVDGKRRKDHEASHDPPVVIQTPSLTSTIPECPDRSQYRDDMYNYNVCLARYGLLMFEFFDAVREGDGERILRCWKFLLLHFKADEGGSTKYALEALYFILQVTSVLSPRQAYRLLWNRSIKGSYTNVPLDLDMEHDNRMVKEAVKKLGGNVNEKLVNRIVKAQALARRMLESFDRTSLIIKRSGRHTTKSDEKDFKKILAKLVDEGALTRKQNRCYTHYSNYKSSFLSGLNVHKMYAWINYHKKRIHKNKACR